MEHNEICPFCDHYMEEGIDPIIDFPCLHRAHSSCFIQLLNNETYSLAEQYHRCQFCQETIFETEEDNFEEEQLLDVQEEGQQIVEEQENIAAPDMTLTYEERLRKRFFESEKMQKDVKAYLKLKRSSSSKKLALKKFTYQKKQEIKHSVTSLREQLGSLLRAQKNSILQSQSYKEYKGLHFRIILLRARISKSYNLDMKSLRRALYRENGYKLWSRESRWTDQPNYIVRRAFYRQFIRF